MEALLHLRYDIEIINPFTPGKKPKFTKTGRLKAVTTLRDALLRKHVIDALTAVSRQEMIRGPTDEPNKFLGWGELSCVMLLTLEQVCLETINARAGSRSGSANMRPIYMNCFRSILKLSLQHGPRGVVRHLVRPFLSYSHGWLSEPLLRDHLADQIWQCVRDLLQDESNRALLQPNYIRNWADACFEQLTGRGALRHSSNVVTNIAGEVLQILASGVESYDTLSQTRKKTSPSKMIAGDFEYSFIAERCCMMMLVAESMPRRKARELQSVAFQTMTKVLSDHALDFLGSNALRSIINASLKPLLTCWSEKKYHNAAVSFSKVLLLLTPSNKKLIDVIRNRILVDLREENHSATIRSGQGISSDYIDTVAACFTFCESLEYADAATTRHGVVILWLRVAFAIISRRVLKKGTTVLAEASDVFDQCSKAAVTVSAILRKHGSFRESEYLHVVRWCTLITNVTAVIAEKIRSASGYSTSFAKSSWQCLYKELREHAVKARYSVRSRGTDLDARGPSAQPEILILETLALLCGLQIIEDATLDYIGADGPQVGSPPYPISRFLPTSAEKATRHEIAFFRNLICRTGLAHDDSGHLRFQLISSLLNSCLEEQEYSAAQAKIPEETSALILALVRGECDPCDKSAVFHRSRLSTSSPSLVALHSFHNFFGLISSCGQINGEGARLVRGVLEQDKVWRDLEGWTTPASVLANSAIDAIVGSRESAHITCNSKLPLSKHFAIDSRQTTTLEKEMLRKLKESIDRAILYKQTGVTPNLSEPTFGDALEVLWTSNEVHTYVDRRALAKGLRIITFLASYLYEGVRHGLISLPGPEDDTVQSTEQELGKLLLIALRSAAKTDPDHLIMNHHLTQVAVKWSSRLSRLIDSDLEINSCSDPQGIWSKLSQMLNKTVISLATTMTRHSFRKLKEQSLKNVEDIQRYAEDEFSSFSSVSSDTRIRKRYRNSGERSESGQKRRRVHSPGFSDGPGRVDHSQESNEGSDNIADDRSEDSDDFSGFASEERENYVRLEESIVPYNRDCDMFFWRKALNVVDIIVRELPQCREIVTELCRNGMDAVDDTERILNPDGFERAALLSSFIDSYVLDARKSVWDVLLAIGTGSAVRSAAADILKIGKRWKQLEQTAHDYISFYADFLEIGRRKHYPVPPEIEASRVVFLDAGRLIFENTTWSHTLRNSSQTQHPESELHRLAIEIVGVSEYFRNRHAFRMPRSTRIAYIRFVYSFLISVHDIQDRGYVHDVEGLEETRLLDLVRVLQNVLHKFLMDAECIVRVVSSRTVPKIVALRSISEEEDLERLLKDCMSQNADCRDCQTFYSSFELADVEETDSSTYPTWGLSTIERNAFTAIHESFRGLGASAKGYLALMTLGELALTNEDLIPYCVTEIIDRVSHNTHFLASGYHILLRLCAAFNYRSPHQFYAAYARLVLPKWFQTQETPEALYNFPAALFVDSEHHKEGMLFDWMREHQASLLSHVLVQEKSVSLDRTKRFAEALQETSVAVLKNNVEAFALLYPMQFTSSLHDRGKLLWHAVDSLLEGQSITLMSEKKTKVIETFLRSISTNCQCSNKNGGPPSHGTENLGFWRDTKSLKPPLYDPLVVALAINHLFASKSDLFIVQKSILQGSLFAEVRDEQTGVILAGRFVDFLKECQRTNVTLLRVLVSIFRFFEGPPSPQPRRSRLDAFFCVGVLWRMLDDAILIKSKNERLAFYKLIAKGFLYQETAEAASWLLSDVQTKLVTLQGKYPKFVIPESDICVRDNYRGYLMSMTETRQLQMYELLSTVSPILVSIIARRTGSSQGSSLHLALGALDGILSLCSKESLWPTVLSNGPFPHQKLFKNARRIYEKARSLVEIAHKDDTVGKLLSSLVRFREVYKRLGKSASVVNMLGCLEEICELLDEKTVNKVSKKIKSEAWLRSSGRDQQTILEINQALSCLIDMIYNFRSSRSHAKECRSSAFFEHNSNTPGEEADIFGGSLLPEITRVLGVLGLLHSQHMSYIQSETSLKLIPARETFGCYEEVESGIRYGLILLQNLLQSNSSVQAQIALDTLLAILKTNDGRRIYAKEKDRFGNLGSFKSTERKSILGGKVSIFFPDPMTGAWISLTNFQDLRSAALWSLPEGRDSSEYSLWMRTLCAVLARTCRSDALNALTSACFSSYEVSCEMLPYLLMDIICDLDNTSCSDVSKLLRHHILLNTRTPLPVLRAFVHALDVLCQIGLEVVSTRGTISWVRNHQQEHTFPYYYVLEISYLDAAKAALRSRAYFSVLRYAQLYIDQKLIRAELKQQSKRGSQRSERRYSSCPLPDPFIENAESAARRRVLPLVREAMGHVSEPDGIRAFGEKSNLARSAANIAALDGDWSTSLSALDVAASESSVILPASKPNLEENDYGSIRGPRVRIDLKRELDVLHSFMGLGAIHIATDYWDGLRNRVSRLGMQGKSVKDTNWKVWVGQLNELRYAAAWKLEQWESPGVLAQANTRRIRNQTVSTGFHKAIYLTLRSLTTKRFGEIPRILSQARNTILQKLQDDSATLSAQSVFENASRLCVCHILERAAFQEITPYLLVKNPTVTPHVLNDYGDRCRFPSSNQSYHPTGESDSAVIAESMDYFARKDVDNADILRQILGDNYGVDDIAFRDGLVLSRDAFHSAIFAEDLPVALCRCLRKDSTVASMSATISSRILSKGGIGAWPRATACLGTPESSLLHGTSQKDDIAWRLQETRLRWSANHDAPSKKKALAAVKDIIATDLGGKALNRVSNDTSERSSFQQSLSWQNGDIDIETLALLRSEACCLAAKWSLDMKTHEPMDLFQMYLESGLMVASQRSKNDRLVGRAHFAMASFADGQINNIDSYRRSRKYDVMVATVRETEQKVLQLKKMKKERLSNPGSRVKPAKRSSRSSRSDAASDAVTNKLIGRDLDLLIRREEKKARQDRSRVERLSETYQKWQVLACQHFARSLCTGSTQDLRAAFRMVALWLDAGSMRTKITKALMEQPEKSPGARKIIVPVSKLLPLAPQLASRLSKPEGLGDGIFQDVLSGTMTTMTGEFPAHCLWQLLALSNATRDSGGQEKYSSLYRGDQDKKDAADAILNRLQHLHGDTVSEMEKIADAYMLLSEADPKRKEGELIELRAYDIAKLGELRHVPVPTVSIPLIVNDHTERIPHILGFERRAAVCAGLSKPLRVACLGSDGNRYPQMVKGRDDLRGDAVMEQMFTILNSLLERDTEAAKRSLHIRTYRIVPLSPFSGIMEFVSNTKQFRQVLVEKGTGGQGRPSRLSLHEKYHPKDLKHEEIMQKAFECLKNSGTPKVVQFLASIWHRFLPAFRFFFTEQWPDPREWFSHQLSYSRSVAVMSMVGFILGLGDRHLSNILLDVSTAEVVHIDFGIAFEQGKLLPTPEHMPFRLTRDLVDGFGIAGVEGVFRRCSEITLSVMRRNKDVMLTVIEVLLHDPMYSWALSPEAVLKEQKRPQESDQDYFESNDLSRSAGESSIEAVARTVNNKMNGSREAKRALNRISEKLDGLEGTERLPVEAHVARLIDEAQAFHVLAPVFPGWSCWL